MEVHLTGETIKHIAATDRSEGGYRVSVSFGLFQTLDQCKRFLAKLEDVALEVSGQTKLEVST